MRAQKTSRLQVVFMLTALIGSLNVANALNFEIADADEGVACVTEELETKVCTPDIQSGRSFGGTVDDMSDNGGGGEKGFCSNDYSSTWIKAEYLLCPSFKHGGKSAIDLEFDKVIEIDSEYLDNEEFCIYRVRLINNAFEGFKIFNTSLINVDASMYKTDSDQLFIFQNDLTQVSTELKIRVNDTDSLTSIFFIMVSPKEFKTGELSFSISLYGKDNDGLSGK